jgi:hypothetical protein
MIPTLFGTRNFMQMCWVVPDARAAATEWVRSTGTGPFFLVEKFSMRDARYRGQPTDVELTIAVAQAGDNQIEIISQNNEVPSIYRELVPRGKLGFHHVALYCRDYDADVAAYTRAGAAVAMSGRVGRNRVCYVDTSASTGCMVELIEADDACDRIFAKIADAARNWDGKDPIRSIS